MDQNKIITAEDILKHHGVPGQKWYVRRYQNPDGSLTALGKKRARKLSDKYEKLTGRKLTDSNNSDNKNKKYTTRNVKNMSTDELNKITNRLNAESNYIDAVNKRNSYDQQVSRGRKFVQKVSNDVIVPAITKASKDQLTKLFDRTLASMLNSDSGGSKKSNTSKKISNEISKVKTTYKQSDLQKEREKLLKTIQNNRSNEKVIKEAMDQFNEYYKKYNKNK